MFPQGCLWHAGSVYVAGPPSIWKFTDTDGDGVADKREEWFKGGTLTGCANDIHGPYLGPDGFLYWTKGAFAEQTHTLGNGTILKDRAAHIFRMRPDGTGLDVVMTGGMDNPVGVAFSREGEVFFTSTFIDFSQPGFRDGIGHATYGAVFGKENDVLNDRAVKRTGPKLTQPFIQFGAGAPSGLCRYESDAFGAGYKDNLFASLFNLHKVTRHELRPNGATYASTDSDFLVSDDVDFHPTDVLEDGDGSLLVIDTGGWYKLCCPSSQLAKPDVFGAIFRVRKAGVKPLSPSALAQARRRLVEPPPMADYTLPAILKKAVWKADPADAKWLRDMLTTPASRSTNSERATLARIAAEGLGRLRDRESVSALFGALVDHSDVDPVLFAALTRALIDTGDPERIRPRLKSNNIAVQRAALMAMDQLGSETLRPGEAVPFLSATDATLRDAAQWIISRRPEWSGELAGWFRQQLGSSNTAVISQLGILTKSDAGQQLLAEAVTNSVFGPETRVAALNAIAGAGLKSPPAVWRDAVRSALGAPNSVSAAASANPKAEPEFGAPLLAAVKAARAFSSDATVQQSLGGIAADARFPENLRLEALGSLPTGSTLDGASVGFLKTKLGSTNTPLARTAAATTLAKSKLNEEQRLDLAALVGGVGPLELPRLLSAFEAGPTEALGLKLLSSLKDSPAAKSLPVSAWKAVFAKFPAAVKQAAEPFLTGLDAEAPKQAARLESLLAQLKTLTGDVRRGQAVFNSAKAACAACHRIGYLGGKLGPDLTSIGQARTERDLLEAIVYPSASFVRSYEPVVVTRKDGEEIAGVLRRDAADEVVIGTGPETEVSVARSEMTEMRPGTVSVMPQGLDGQLTTQELADLVTFLKNTKWGAK